MALHRTWRDYWTIYPNNLGGWFAWHAQDARRIDLIPCGSIADPHPAIIEAEKILVSLYESGSLNTHQEHDCDDC